MSNSPGVQKIVDGVELVRAERARNAEALAQCNVRIQTLLQEVDALNARIAELEAGQPTPDPDPIPEPEPEPQPEPPPVVVPGNAPVPPAPTTIIDIHGTTALSPDDPRLKKFGVIAIRLHAGARLDLTGRLSIPNASNLIIEGEGGVSTNQYAPIMFKATNQTTGWVMPGITFVGMEPNFTVTDDKFAATWSPFVNVNRQVLIGSRFDRFRRLSSGGRLEIYGVQAYRLYEDAVYSGGFVRGLTIDELGIEKHRKWHADLVQAFGPCDIEDVRVEKLNANGLNCSRIGGTGSRFKNIVVKTQVGPGHHGVLIETQRVPSDAADAVGPYDLTFENVSIPNSVRVRGVNFGGDANKTWSVPTWMRDTVRFAGCTLGDLASLAADPRIKVIP